MLNFYKNNRKCLYIKMNKYTEKMNKYSVCIHKTVIFGQK